MAELKRFVWYCVCTLGAVAVIFVAAYAAYAGVTWYEYGRPQYPQSAESRDPLLDSVMPAYDVARRQQVAVAAPAETTFAAVCETNLQRSAIVRAIFKARAIILGSKAETKPPRPLGIVDQAKAWGWAELAEEPGREIIFGAATRPWDANPVFRALPPGEFEKFQEPGYVKIVWMLRVDPRNNSRSILSTETRVATTDSISRAKFRRYWSWASPGMFLIRWAALREGREEAERRADAPPAKGRESATLIVLTVIAAIVLIVHGLIHLMGTAVYAWRAEIKGLSYSTRLLSGRWDLGIKGVRVFGWLWVLPAGGFVLAAIALLAGWPWWNPVLVAAALLSIALILFDWSNAFRGAVVDVAILLAALIGPRIAAWFSWLVS